MAKLVNDDTGEDGHFQSLLRGLEAFAANAVIRALAHQRNGTDNMSLRNRSRVENTHLQLSLIHI